MLFKVLGKKEDIIRFLEMNNFKDLGDRDKKGYVGVMVSVGGKFFYATDFININNEPGTTIIKLGLKDFKLRLSYMVNNIIM